MLSNLFEKHGQFCAKHPWEVIVAVLTLTACMLSMENSSHAGAAYATNSFRSEETNAVDIIFMTIIRCSAVLYSYYQFRKLRKLGSNYILGIAGLFTVFSSFVFSSTVINFLKTDVSDLKDALFFFVLVIDLSKASVLAQFALNSSSQKEVNCNIARGMSLLGPTVTLDTLVGTLVISVGTLAGVKRLETLCCFACFSFVVNYFVFMTFYPACLSLVLELSRSGSCGLDEKGSYCERASPLAELLYDEGHKPNPVVQRVKVIMSAGMMIVHAHSRWSLSATDSNDSSQLFPVMSGIVGVHSMPHNGTHTDDLRNYLLRFLAMTTDHIVILILLLALTLKYYFFDDEDDLVSNAIQNRQSSVVQRLLRSQDKIVQTDAWLVGSTEAASQTGGDALWTRCESESESHCQAAQTQTDVDSLAYGVAGEDGAPARSIDECCSLYEQSGTAESLTNEEICNLVAEKKILPRELEKVVDDSVRAVAIRRRLCGRSGNFETALTKLPFQYYDYKQVVGKCCENVVGYIPVPVGLAGPLLVNQKPYYIPMATTEGCLVASMNRGCKILNASGGVRCVVQDYGMTRAPVVRFPSVQQTCRAKTWIESNKESIRERFDSTSSFARLKEIKCMLAGRYMYIRFTATTGDAMGMNMVSKGAEEALLLINKNVKDMEILSVSGNVCTDKKPSAINWIEGRGKSVVVDAVIPGLAVERQLRTSSKKLEDLNKSKNLMGSCIAGSIGGFNAHAANIVTAMFIATGQDPAQNVGSSNCMTTLECTDNGDLYVSCFLPSLEVGTVGGGTALHAQAACLDILGVKGPNVVEPAENAKTLAQIIGGAVLAGELSLMGSLSAGDLVKSHLTHNRTALSEKTCSTVKRVRENTMPKCAPS